MSDPEPGQTLTLLRDGDQDWLQLPGLRLRFESAGAKVQEVALQLAPLTVGSAPDCNFVCTDPRVSRHHCRVTLETQGVQIEDLESKNGTFVDGVRVFRAALAPGQTAAMGSTRLTVIPSLEPTRLALSSSSRFGAAHGASAPMRVLFAELERAAKTDSTILLLGETGTGKELLARAIHDHSSRSEGPFVVLDCGGVPENLLENELFGHEAGAFTGATGTWLGVVERAHGGTLFLDELGELPLNTQTKLLRVLEERTVRRLGGDQTRRVDLRIVAATHRNLRARAQAGEFRSDLLFRISVLEFNVPPLRDRLEDIPLLVERLLAAQNPPRHVSNLPSHVLEMFRHHRWPGNVRELRNVLARLALFPESAALALQPDPKDGPTASTQIFQLPLREARVAAAESFERSYLLERLRQSNQNVAAAAQAMGISRQMLYRLIAQHDLPRDDN